jgi:hypothetical protein
MLSNTQKLKTKTHVLYRENQNPKLQTTEKFNLLMKKPTFLLKEKSKCQRKSLQINTKHKNQIKKPEKDLTAQSFDEDKFIPVPPSPTITSLKLG